MQLRTAYLKSLFVICRYMLQLLQLSITIPRSNITNQILVNVPATF